MISTPTYLLLWHAIQEPYLDRLSLDTIESLFTPRRSKPSAPDWPLPPTELELELIQTQMAQKPMLRAEVGMRVRCANKASAE